VRESMNLQSLSTRSSRLEKEWLISLYIPEGDKQREPESYFVKHRETPRQFWQNWQSRSLALAACLAIAFLVISFASF